MESTLRQIPREAKALYPKAEQLFELCKEANSKAAHLMAAVFFYATRLNFVSLELDYMAEAFNVHRREDSD
jgi:hypothetical protein